MFITDSAKEYIEAMMQEAGIKTLRFMNAGGGCCGPSYQLALDHAQENDIVERINEIEVALDPAIVDIVSQLTLDTENDDEGVVLIVRGGSSCC